MSILFHPEFNIINVTESTTGISCEYVFIENSKLYKYVVRRYDKKNIDFNIIHKWLNKRHAKTSCFKDKHKDKHNQNPMINFYPQSKPHMALTVSNLQATWSDIKRYKIISVINEIALNYATFYILYD